MSLQDIKSCIIIPTYNNHKTLRRVLDAVLQYGQGREVYVVNDGSTDTTPEILNEYKDRLTVLLNEVNQGKGFSLKKAFRRAIEDGFEYAITIDSDGQHFASDIPAMIEKVKQNPGNLIMGSRNMNQESVPGKSSFGNKFSNFWFFVETGIQLPDTQTGFRAYPLRPLKRMKLFTNKFELEIEVIVRLAWRGVKFTPVPIQVLYDENERVSHFRPGRDFFRISVLNSVLFTLALLIYYPRKLFSKETFQKIKDETIKPNESTFVKSMSLGFGVFMGIFPIWGFQLLVGIPLAVLFKLNKVLFITAANISIPPMIPIIIFVSYYMGGFFFEDQLQLTSLSSISLESIHLNFMQYLVGSILFSLSAFVAVFAISFLLLSVFRKKKNQGVTAAED